MDYKKQPGETELQYIWRLHHLVDQKQITWSQLADYVNREYRTSPDSYRTESSYRKSLRAAEKYYEEVFSHMQGDSYAEEIQKKKRELEKAKIQLRDERNEYSKSNRVIARVEQKLDYLFDVLTEQSVKQFPAIGIAGAKEKQCVRQDVMTVVLSDLHIGQTFNNHFGKYDSDIAYERLTKYLNEVFELKKKSNVSKCNIALLGDLISGNIHQSITVTNRENVIEQIKIASEYISSFCYKLCLEFDSVELYSVAGNHSRINRKDEALHSERLDDLIAWIVSSKLSHIENFKYVTNKYDNGISSMVIGSKEYVLVHGDYDGTKDSDISKLSFMIEHIPYAIVMGHNHSNLYTHSNGVYVIQGGCLSGGGDQFTLEHRMKSTPEQIVFISNSDGEIQSIHPIKLI